jgi:hypothetical protein
MAEDEITQPDLSFIPETFRGEDGALDIDGFKSHFDELSSFKAQADEAATAIPESPDGYQWGVSEDYAWPEGFDPALFKQPVLKEDGTPKLGPDGQPEMRDLTPQDLLSSDDEDVPALREVLHKYGAKPELAGELAQIMLNRELRSMKAAGEAAAEERKALGPQAKQRISTVTRSLNSRMPAAQAKAVLDSITSADALRGIEALLKGNANTPPNPAPGGMDHSSMSARDLIAAGLSKRHG